MTDLAVLAIKVDASQADAAAAGLDKLTAAGGRAEMAVEGVGKSSQTASQAADQLTADLKAAAGAGDAYAKAFLGADAAIKDLAVAQAAAKREIDAARAAYKAGEVSLEDYHESILRTKTALQAISSEHQTAINNFTRFKKGADDSADGMNNSSSAGKMLAMQLSQVAQQGAATGQYLQALAIQLPDIAIGMSNAGASAGAFARFLGGPWGIALTSAAAALVPLISRLFETKDAADKARYGLDALIAKYRQEQAARNSSATSQADLNKLLERRSQLEAEIAQRGVRGANGQLMFVYKQQQELKEVNQGIYEGRLAIDRYRVSAIDLNAQMSQIYSSQMKVEKSTKAHASATRSAKKETDEFATSLAKVAQSLGIYQQDALDEVAAQLAKIEAANELAFGQKLQSASDAAASNINDVAAANENWNDALRDTLGYLGQLGGAAGVLGGIGSALLGLQTGNFSGVGGAAGYLLNSIGNMQWRDPATEDGLGQIRLMREEFSKALDDVFGGNGTFFKAIEGASMGAAAGSIFGNSQANQVGGLLGGVAGKVAGEALGKAIGGTLGKAMGPLGSIIGGALGAAIGGLFKKDKYGTATFAGGDGYGTSGNSQKNQTGANSLADSFQSALNNIAKSLDATLGAFQVSLGVTNGKINVNPGLVTGMIGTTKQRDTIDFGEDQAAALKYAIKNAIEDGALEGLSEGWKKFLVESSDIEKALGQIGDLKNAYDELASLKDPEGFALQQLDKAFDELRKTATAAGDDLARVEELYGLKRKEIVEKYAEDTLDIERQARSMDAEIARLQGDAIKATAIARELEREQIDETLRARYDLIASLQDEAQAASDAAAASDRILALQIRLSRAQGDEATAKALENMQELNSAQTEQERQMLRMIHETDRLMEQQSALTATYSEQLGAVGAMIDRMKQASQGLRDFANELFGANGVGDANAMRQRVVNAMKAGDVAALPGLINAYLPIARQKAGSLDDYYQEVAFAAQGSRDVANINDARADYSGALMASWMTGREFNMADLADRIERGLAQLNDSIVRSDANNVQGMQRQISNSNEANSTLARIDANGAAVLTGGA